MLPCCGPTTKKAQHSPLCKTHSWQRCHNCKACQLQGWQWVVASLWLGAPQWMGIPATDKYLATHSINGTIRTSYQVITHFLKMQLGHNLRHDYIVNHAIIIPCRRDLTVAEVIPMHFRKGFSCRSLGTSIPILCNNLLHFFPISTVLCFIDSSSMLSM